MSLIAPQIRQERAPLTVRLDLRLQALLKHYTEFIASSTDYVIGQALLVAFRSDPDFQRWLDQHHQEDAGQIAALAGEQPAGRVSRLRPAPAGQGPRAGTAARLQGSARDGVER